MLCYVFVVYFSVQPRIEYGCVNLSILYAYLQWKVWNIKRNLVLHTCLCYLWSFKTYTITTSKWTMVWRIKMLLHDYPYRGDWGKRKLSIRHQCVFAPQFPLCKDCQKSSLLAITASVGLARFLDVEHARWPVFSFRTHAPIKTRFAQQRTNDKACSLGQTSARKPRPDSVPCACDLNCLELPIQGFFVRKSAGKHMLYQLMLLYNKPNQTAPMLILFHRMFNYWNSLKLLCPCFDIFFICLFYKLYFSIKHGFVYGKEQSTCIHIHNISFKTTRYRPY